MFKKLTILLLALLLPAAALAEVYEGVTAAISTVTVTSQATGTLKTLALEAGSRVAAGDALMELQPQRVFAAQDGEISLIEAQEGEEVSGVVLELAPLERYQVYCTVEKAYQSAPTTLVHSGETLYLRCTSDGTHRAVGLVTLIDGGEYRVLTLGGELYIGETVYLYRDADFASSQRVGIGTVVGNDPQSYEADGTLTALRVSQGEVVERGQLLYEVDGGSVPAPVSGILTSLSAQAGDSVEAGQAVAEIVPDGQVCVEIQVDQADAARITPGQTAQFALASDADERAYTGTVIGNAWLAENEKYTVRILPDGDVQLPLGMTATVRL